MPVHHWKRQLSDLHPYKTRDACQMPCDIVLRGAQTRCSHVFFVGPSDGAESISFSQEAILPVAIPMHLSKLAAYLYRWYRLIPIKCSTKYGCAGLCTVCVEKNTSLWLYKSSPFKTQHGSFIMCMNRSIINDKNWLPNNKGFATAQQINILSMDKGKRAVRSVDRMESL